MVHRLAHRVAIGTTATQYSLNSHATKHHVGPAATGCPIPELGASGDATPSFEDYASTQRRRRRTHACAHTTQVARAAGDTAAAGSSMVCRFVVQHGLRIDRVVSDLSLVQSWAGVALAP